MQCPVRGLSPGAVSGAAPSNAGCDSPPGGRRLPGRGARRTGPTIRFQWLKFLPYFFPVIFFSAPSLCACCNLRSHWLPVSLPLSPPFPVHVTSIDHSSIRSVPSANQRSSPLETIAVIGSWVKHPYPPFPYINSTMSHSPWIREKVTDGFHLSQMHWNIHYYVTPAGVVDFAEIVIICTRKFFLIVWNWHDVGINQKALSLGICFRRNIIP